MVKYIGVWDFHDTLVDDDTLNGLSEEKKYSTILGNEDWSVKYMILNPKNKPLSALIVESNTAFNSLEAKKSMQNLLEETKSVFKIPIIIFTTDDRSTVQMDYSLKQGVHYDRFVSKIKGSCLKELRNTLSELLD